MPTISLFSLLQAYNVRDYGASGKNNGDVSTQINYCLADAAAASPAGGLVIVPPGTYRCDRSVNVPSNITLMGFGPASYLQLGASAEHDVLSLEGVSNVRIQGLRIDGNRTNNASGTRHGIYLHECSDVWLSDLVVESAIYDGIHVNSCDRVRGRGCKAYDNGRNGILIYYSRNCNFESSPCYDNCRVSTLGSADGIRLEMVSVDNSIVNCDCYESALAGGRQGYGVREATGELCSATTVVGGSMRNNATGYVLFEDSTSMALTTLYQKVS